MRNPILVIAAMEDAELGYLKENLKDLRINKNNICTFYEGKISEKPVVLCSSNIGTINVAASTTLAIEKYNPIAVISEGTAGGYGESIHKGDIVIGTACINITSAKTNKRKSGEGANIEEYKLTTFICGEDDKLILQKASDYLIEKAKQIKRENMHFGTIGSRRYMEYGSG